MTFSYLRNPLIVLCALCFVLSGETFAKCNPNAATAGFDQYSDGKNSFECAVENVCLGQKFGGTGWNFDTSKQLVKKHDKTKYPDLNKESKSFDEIRTIYQTTQDEIFECAILKSKHAGHTQIIKDYDPSETSKKYLEKLNKNVESQLKTKECLSADESDKVYNYKDLLDSTSYEQCVYHMYLYYYEEKAGNSPGILLGKNTGLKKATDISNELNETRTMLQNEYKLSRESLDIALRGYENYHKYYIPHAMMQMTYIELSEDKSLIAKTMHTIKDLISRFMGAQKQ